VFTRQSDPPVAYSVSPPCHPCPRYVTPAAHVQWSRVIAHYFSEACQATHPSCGMSAQPLLFHGSGATSGGTAPSVQVNVR
jgi:hypothetical protein